MGVAGDGQHVDHLAEDVALSLAETADPRPGDGAALAQAAENVAREHGLADATRPGEQHVRRGLAGQRGLERARGVARSIAMFEASREVRLLEYLWVGQHPVGYRGVPATKVGGTVPGLALHLHDDAVASHRGWIEPAGDDFPLARFVGAEPCHGIPGPAEYLVAVVEVGGDQHALEALIGRVRDCARE